MINRPRLLRITTVPLSLKLLLDGQFVFFHQQGFETLTVSADGPEVQELKASGVTHQTVNMTRAITPVRDLIALFSLIRIIKKFKPDIVHTHTPKAGLLGMLAAWICRVPIRMHTVAGLPLMEAKGIKRLALKLSEQITYACAHRIYPNSVGLMEYIKSQITNRKSKITIIGKGSSNGIDTNFFSRNENLKNQAIEIRNHYQIPNEAIVFSFVGRVVKDKGIVELLEAFKKIETTVQAYLLLIGPFEDELDPLPDEAMKFLKNNNRVIVSEFKHDVRPWILASDIFVFPSYREGFPNAVMQAACLEVPCIVSDINGCNEIIQNNETGLVIPPKKVTPLYEAMLLLSNDRAKGISFGKKSREFIVTNFGQQYVWSELLKEYRELLEKRK